MRMRYGFSVVALLAATSCNSAAVPADHVSEPQTRTVQQPVGEATIAYWFAGAGAEPMPSYEERVAWHLINQVRMNTDVFDVRDMDGNLIPPSAPLTQQTGMTEVGRWQGQQSLTNLCYCVFDMMSNSFMEAGAGSNPYTCCTAGYVAGTIRCAGPIVSCGDDGMMEPTDRWGLLNKGPGEIRGEVFWTSTEETGALGVEAANWFLGNALGFALNSRDSAGAAARTSIPLLPDECRPAEDSCTGGSCRGPNGESDCDPTDPEAPNECIGECQGGEKAGEGCTLPEPIDPVACDPENLPRGWYWSFLFGQTSEPVGFLNDGIHITFDESTTLIQVNYFDPAGPPQELNTVFDTSCNPMTRSFMRPNEGMGGDMGGNDMGGESLPYVGNTFQYQTNVTGGCQRYIIQAIDAEGFEHTYPTFGSLGMQMEGGVVVENDESCPIWLPEERPSPGCLPSVDECTEGSTRLCYTGRPGTEDKGMCEAGTETCRGGRWAGICVGEVRPEMDDVCGDDTDNNCNGFVDEDCPVPVQPEPDTGVGDSDAGNNGANNGTNGGGDAGGPNDPDTKDEDGGGCCATIHDSPSKRGPFGGLIALLAAGLVVARRRR